MDLQLTPHPHSHAMHAAVNLFDLGIEYTLVHLLYAPDDGLEAHVCKHISLDVNSRGNLYELNAFALYKFEDCPFSQVVDVTLPRSQHRESLLLDLGHELPAASLMVNVQLALTEAHLQMSTVAGMLKCQQSARHNVARTGSEAAGCMPHLQSSACEGSTEDDLVCSLTAERVALDISSKGSQPFQTARQRVQ